MIVPRDEIQAILRYGIGEVVVEGDPPPVGETRWVRPTPRSGPACEARVADFWAVEGGHAVLLEKVAPEFPAPTQSRRPGAKSELKLSREQRSRLLDGDVSPLTFEKKPPVEEGGSYVLLWSRPTKILVRDDGGKVIGVFHPEPEPLLSIKVTHVTRRARGGWSVAFTVIDRRSTPRFLRRVPPSLAPEVMKADKARGPSDDEIEEARQEGTYTTSQHGAVDDQEAIDWQWQDKNSSLRATQQQILEEEMRARLSLGDQLDSLLEDAHDHRSDEHVRNRVRKIRREIELLARDLVQGSRAA